MRGPLGSSETMVHVREHAEVSLSLRLRELPVMPGTWTFYVSLNAAVPSEQDYASASLTCFLTEAQKDCVLAQLTGASALIVLPALVPDMGAEEDNA